MASKRRRLQDFGSYNDLSHQEVEFNTTVDVRDTSSVTEENVEWIASHDFGEQCLFDHNLEFDAADQQLDVIQSISHSRSSSPCFIETAKRSPQKPKEDELLDRQLFITLF